MNGTAARIPTFWRAGYKAWFFPQETVFLLAKNQREQKKSDICSTFSKKTKVLVSYWLEMGGKNQALELDMEKTKNKTEEMSQE